MEIQEQRHGAVSVLKPVGPLTGTDAEQFKNCALLQASKALGRLVVDASAVPFLDSSGIECLIDVSDALFQGGRALKLCAATETVKETLDLTGFGHAFEFVDDVNSGVRSFL
jgi:anti-sigma B factor antagonist